MIALAASLLLAAVEAAATPVKPVIPPDATAAELVKSCRTMIPADVKIEGRVILRNRKGIVQFEKPYVLTREKGVTKLDLDDETLAKTDVTRDDLELAYLWWDDFSFDTEKSAESVHGMDCAIVLMKKGDRTVRVWVDRKTGAMVQAEEMKDGKAIRRLWGARIKKFGERWMANVMEVETLGSGHRTKITVEKLDNET